MLQIIIKEYGTTMIGLFYLEQVCQFKKKKPKNLNNSTSIGNK